MVKIQEEVEGKVARLLAMVCNDKTDPEAYEFVLAKLTRMAMLGTAPAGCRPRNSQDSRSASQGLTWSYKSESEGEDDFSDKKESFIAP